MAARGFAPATTSRRHCGPQDIGQMRLSEVIGALSSTLDLAEGQPAGHSLRCTWIGTHIGQIFGMAPDRLSDLYYTLLFKDAGGSSNAARLWQLYGGDERLTKHAYKSVDSQSLLDLARFTLRHTGPGSPCAGASGACSTSPATASNWPAN